MGITFWIYTLFWIGMLYHCSQYEVDRVWLWIILFTHIIGASLYFVVRFIPRFDFSYFIVIKRWLKRQELWTAEANAMHINKAHQYIILGDLLTDLKLWEKAKVAYETALEREANNDQALWGISQVYEKEKNYPELKKYLDILLELNPNYKYGEAELLYIKALLEMQENDLAETHLESHITHWRKAESYLLLAELKALKEDKITACTLLETMIKQLRGSPSFHYKQNRKFVDRANKLLRKWRK